MSETAEHKVERPEWWPAGPWMTEPDKVNWKTEAGLPGMIVRSRSGHLCGYVAVTKDHPWYGRGYGDDSVNEGAPECVIDVHGGLTYSNKCAGHICHVPEPGEPDDVWWFGFDCAHSGDWSPSSFAPYLSSPSMPGEWPCFEKYRDVEYVRAEVESLAAQLATRTSTDGEVKP